MAAMSATRAHNRSADFTEGVTSAMCTDTDDRCAGWVASFQGLCDARAEFMAISCRASCATCGCACDMEWEGENCELRISTCTAQQPCLNGGACTDSLSGYT